MGVRSYEDLYPHIGHTFRCHKHADASAGVDDAVVVECEDCNEAIMAFERGDEDECVEWTVWLLRIHNETGSELYCFKRRQTALEQLYAYVIEHWKRDLPDTPLPVTLKSAIDVFFIGNELESYTLCPQPVLCEVVT